MWVLQLQVPAHHPKPGDGSGMAMPEPEQLPSVAGEQGLAGRPLAFARGSALRLRPSSAACPGGRD